MKLFGDNLIFDIKLWCYPMIKLTLTANDDILAMIKRMLIFNRSCATCFIHTLDPNQQSPFLLFPLQLQLNN